MQVRAFAFVGLLTGGLLAEAVNVNTDLEVAAARVQLLERKVAALEEAKVKATRRSMHHSGAGRIAPELEPVSDKKFFDGKKADYTTDNRPEVRDSFRYPYPIVQADATYDEDYVKDENNDNGHWSAQMKYDDLRSKLSKKKAIMDKAQEKEREEQKELDATKKKEKEADAKHDAAKAKLQEANTAENQAEDALKAANQTVDAQEKVVEKEMEDLEECKRQLAEAKAKLEKLTAEKKKVNAEKEEAAKEGNVEKEQAAEKEEERLAKELDEEQSEHMNKKKSLKEAENDVAETEKELQAAADKLRKLREEQAEKYGHLRKTEGSVNCPPGCKEAGWRSSATAPSTLAGLCLGLAVAFWSAA